MEAVPDTAVASVRVHGGAHLNNHTVHLLRIADAFRAAAPAGAS